MVHAGNFRGMNQLKVYANILQCGCFANLLASRGLGRHAKWGKAFHDDPNNGCEREKEICLVRQSIITNLPMTRNLLPESN